MDLGRKSVTSYGKSFIPLGVVLIVSDMKTRRTRK